MKIINFFKQLFSTSSIFTVKEEQDAPLLITGGTSKKGNITIDSAESLAELKKMTYLDGDIKFFGTPDGLDFSALDSLKKVTGSIIFSETEFTHLTSLNALTDIGKDLKIGKSISFDDEHEMCFFLEEINAFSALKNIGGRLIISSNYDLLKLNGFSSLESVGGLMELSENSVLAESTDFPQLKKVGGELMVENNEALKELPTFGSLKTIKGDLRLSDNKGIKEISGFAELEDIKGELVIDSNDSMIRISGFNTLRDVGKDILISENPALKEITGFKQLTTIGDDFYFNSNKLLTVSPSTTNVFEQAIKK